MRLTTEEAVEKLSQRTYNNTEDRLQKNLQRRSQVTDLYGVEYTRLGGNGLPATFYISISPDMIYLERFEFKLIVSPFVAMTASGLSNATIEVNGDTSETSLSIVNNDISPKKHKHQFGFVNTHTHNITNTNQGHNVTANDFTMTIEGVDVTAYLKAQFDDYGNTKWPNGAGVFPRNGNTIEVEDNYDILEVASLLHASGQHEDAEKLVSAGYKLERLYLLDFYPNTSHIESLAVLTREIE